MGKILFIKLADAYSVFLVDRKARGFTATTIRYYEQKLGAFIAWAQCGGAQSVKDLTATLMGSYLVSLHERGLKEMTVIGAARAMRAFCNFMVAEGWIARSPMTTVPNPKPARHILPAFSPEEATRLLTAAKGLRARALILFLLDTGLRAAEVVKLNGEDVDLRNGTVREMLGYAHSQGAERLLIEHIGLCWLRLQTAEMPLTRNVTGSHNAATARYLDARLELAQRRYLRAVALLERVRRHTPSVQINVAGQQVVQGGK